MEPSQRRCGHPHAGLISPDIAHTVLRDGGDDVERFLDTVLAADVYRTLDALAFDTLDAAAVAPGNTLAYVTSPSVTLRKAVTQLEVDGFVATHVFVHPTEHEALALATDAENRYYFGSPVEANVPRVHSMKSSRRRRSPDRGRHRRTHRGARGVA